MKKYIASVRDSETKKLMNIEREYKSKKAFEVDLRANGYRIRFISTPEKFDEDCEKYYEIWETNKRVKNAIYAEHKKSAERMNMTVKEYRAWLKRI